MIRNGYSAERLKCFFSEEQPVVLYCNTIFSPEKSSDPERIFSRTAEMLFSEEQLAVLYCTIFSPGNQSPIAQETEKIKKNRQIYKKRNKKMLNLSQRICIIKNRIILQLTERMKNEYEIRNSLRLLDA